jgi:hypothetical protein
MSASKMTRLLFVAISVLSLPLCWAQAPSGTVTLPIDSTTTPVWDLSGDLAVNQPMKGAGGTIIPMSFGVSLLHDANGRLRGSGLTQLAIGEDVIASDYTVTGSVSGGGDTTRVSLTVKLTGQDVIASVDTPFKITITYHLTVDPATLSLTGTSSGNAKFNKLKGGGSINSDVSIPLPAGSDGSWTVQMEILPLTSLAGSGSFVFATRSLPTGLSGSFSKSSNVTKVKLTGINEGKGSTLNLNLSTTADGTVDIQSLKGKVLGQSVKQ